MVLVAIGLALCLALEAVHVSAYVVPTSHSVCSLGPRFDCDSVALSRHAVILGVPTPVWGLAGFWAIGVAVYRRSKWWLYLSAISAAASIGLLVEELVHLDTMCLLCEGVHVVSVGLLGMGWWVRRRLLPIKRFDAFHIFTVPVAMAVTTAAIVPHYWAISEWIDGEIDLPTGTTEDGRPWIGAETPTVTVHEFVDYNCPYCALATGRMHRRLREHSDELRVVREQHPRMPCTPDTRACEHARAAVCAQLQNKFWQMDSWLFSHVPKRRDVDHDEVAATLGLDVDAFSRCMADPVTYQRVDLQYRAARELGISGTPGYAIDGERVPVDQIDPLLERALE
jgi:uncharacterized membrane protein/predicted DsbA family dithiol-disulfide isomerase